MSSSAPPPVARMGTMKRSRLARAANGGSHLEDGQKWIMVALVVICGENGDNNGDMMRIYIYISILLWILLDAIGTAVVMIRIYYNEFIVGE